MAEQSRVLNTPGAEKQTKRELFDALRQELEYVTMFFKILEGSELKLIVNYLKI